MYTAPQAQDSRTGGLRTSTLPHEGSPQYSIFTSGRWWRSVVFLETWILDGGGGGELPSFDVTGNRRNQCTRASPANTKPLYKFCTTSAQRHRRWADVVKMLYKCFVFAGSSVIGIYNLVKHRRNTCDDNWKWALPEISNSRHYVNIWNYGDVITYCTRTAPPNYISIASCQLS